MQKLQHECGVGRAIGHDIRRLFLTDLVAHHRAGTKELAWSNVIASSIGSDSITSAPEEAVKRVREIIAKHCNHDLSAVHQAPTDEGCATALDSNLIRAWQRTAKDPDDAVCDWLLTGAPAGLAIMPKSCGIFPEVSGEAEVSIDTLDTEYDTFCNYSGVDNDDTASTEFEKHLGLKRLRAFDTVEETSAQKNLFYDQVSIDQVAFSVPSPSRVRAPLKTSRLLFLCF